MTASMPGADPHHRHASRPIPPTAVISAQLENILNSRVFKHADNLRDLLRFIVQETMAGRGEALKEYLLAVTVLGKDESFDPKADSIVRAQMRRLRDHLDRYYATEGRSDLVLIEIPYGAYMPAFRFRSRDAGAPAGTDAERVVVGRDKELAGLRTAFDLAAAGQGRVIGLSGEPGIGKTTVADTWLRELAKSDVDHYLARGRCSERLAGSEAYLPWLEALETLLRGSDESLAQVMSVIAPAWYGQIGPLTGSSSTEPRRVEGSMASQDRLKRELTAFLEELQRQRPLVIVLDDLHWSDASTIDILSYAASRSASQRVLVVGTYRPADAIAINHPFLRVKLELQLHGLYQDMPMPFLTRTDVDRYLELRFPQHRFPAELATRIHDRTEGNPLFVADLVRFLRDCGALAEREGRWVMVGQLPELEHEIPESVRSMVEKKIAQLSEDDYRLLVAASVQGREFDSAVVSKALGLNAALVEQQLDVLERVHSFVQLLEEHEFADRTVTLRYRFVHGLYQNALFASLRPTRRASLSAAVAESLLGHYPQHRAAIASQLAMLFESAREFARAAEYFLVAAQHAARVSANQETVVLARRGLDALAQLPDTPHRARQELRLLTILGPASMVTVGYGAPEVETIYARARELCELVGDTPQLFPIVWGNYQYWLARAEYRTARALGERMLTLAEKAGDARCFVMAHHALANTAAFSGDFEESRAHVECEIAAYMPERDQSLAAVYGGYDPRSTAMSGNAGILWRLGYPDLAVQRGDLGIALAREIGHAGSVALALAFTAMVHQWRRDTERTREHAEAALSVIEHEGGPWFVFGTVLRGWALAHHGEAEEGIARLRQGIAAWKAQGARCLQPYFLALLAEAYTANGQPAEALTALEEALAVTAQTHEGYAAAELYRLEGELIGDADRADACFQRAIEISRQQKARSFELRAVMSLTRLHQRRGQATAAREMLAEVYGWFTEGFDTADLKDAAALIAGRDRS